MNSPYVLEVQRFDPYGHLSHPEWNGKYEHIGYMNKVFKTKNEAAEYYNTHNPHMRRLNAYSTWRSDWDSETHLRYIVRQYGGEYLKIEAFDKNLL